MSLIRDALAQRGPPEEKGVSRTGFYRLLIVLTLLTGALYWPTTHQDFTVFDDGDYVYDNPGVKGGLSWEGAQWAFTNIHSANWHPLTWISHQADWVCYGSFAGGHHLTNLLLHTLNTLLLFLLLRRLTGNTSASWIVAALFGWHPLHTESVAWIAERKDLLSTLSLIGTLWAYAGYAKARGGETGDGFALRRVRAGRCYGAALMIFAAGLLCKPMLVTLPCLLLLLDYWPFRRGVDPLADKAATLWAKLFAEKLPFFALAGASCVVTVIAQRAGGAIRTADEVPLLLRALNIPSAYGDYLRQTIWPHPLCLFYPLPNHLPVFTAVVSALLLTAISWLAWRHRQDHPWQIIGWLWFLGSLVPVIGLLQVGRQAHADRYMYIPSIGLFVAIVWTGQQLARRWPRGRAISFGLAAAGLVACLALTRNQLRYWRTNVELMTYALAHTENNATIQNMIGTAFGMAGNHLESIAHYQEAVRLEPKSTIIRLNLGMELQNAGQLEEAAREFGVLLRQFPHSKLMLNNLGSVRAQQGKCEEALAQFREAIRWHPEFSKSYHNAGVVLQAMGDARAAATNYFAALRLSPRSAETLNRLAGLFARCPMVPYHRPEMAVRLAKQATAIARDEMPDYLDTLAAAYAAAGQYTNAVIAAQQAIEIAQGQSNAWLVSKLQSDLRTYQEGRTPEADWKQARYTLVRYE